MSTPAARLLDAFDRQVGWCAAGASPFSARVLALSRRWLETEPEALAVLAAIDRDPLAAAVALRWLGGLHHLALLGRKPWAGLWPPAAGVADAADAADDATLTAAIALAWQRERPHLRGALSRPPQTNEVMRSAALLPGLLHVAATLQRPLHLAEIGSSAGLNLWCDRFRHEPAGPDGGTWAWGDTAAALTLRPEWRGPPPPTDAPLAIARRAGCDAAPLDLAQPGEDLRLASFIWADQHERLARLRAAIAVVRPLRGRSPAVQTRQAVDFVREQLAARHEGEAFVLMHSVVWQYIAPEEQEAITARMHAAAAQATAASPLAWLRFEPPRPDLRVELRCTTWPGGQERLLAECHPHGASVHWRAPGAGAGTAAVAASPA